MKKFIDILGIILPVLIIIVVFIRIFVQKIKGLNGLTMLFAILLLLVGIIRFFAFGNGNDSDHHESKLPPLTVSKHSEIFNLSMENLLNAYYKITDGFVNGDISLINQTGNNLKTALDSFKVEELKQDSLIYETALQPLQNIKSEIVSIIADPSITEKRGSLNIFSNELFSLLSIVRYDRAKLYWLECGSAFGEEKPGNWLSKTGESANPYGQKNCADIKTNINFVPADTTKKR
ncbi:MAG: DUF3347 domain-containing protein [Ginsengibacter sp.]